MTLIRAASAWLAGIALALRWPLPAPWLCAGAAAAAVAAWCLRARPWCRAAALAVLFGALGALRQATASAPPGPDHVSRYNDRGTVTLRGRIVAEPDRRDWGVQYRVVADAVRSPGGWVPTGGLVQAQAARFPLHRYGETVVLTARLQTPPQFDTFDYRAWLAQRGVHSVARRARMEAVACCGGNPARRALIAVRERGRRALAAALPEPECSLATGIVLGDARGIPARVDDAFRVTNTTHVIAISGSNVALLLGVTLAFLSRAVGRRRAVPPALAALGLYTALVGADAAVVRAAVMGGVMLLGHYLGRPSQAAVALMAAAWAMTAYRPGYLQDLGFQLSFAATVGLLLFSAPLSGAAERLAARCLGGRRARAVTSLAADAVLVTLAAQLTTWPVIARQVGQVSVTGLVANFLIVPAQAAVMMLGGLTALLGGLWLPAGRVPGALAWLPLAYTVRVVEWAAGLPLASVPVAPADGALAAYYGLLAVAAMPGPRPWRPENRARAIAALTGARGAVAAMPGARPWRPENRARAIAALTGARSAAVTSRARPWALPLAAAACALAWAGALSRPDGLLHLHVLDVGQGDALLVVTPSGRRMLVDGGPSPSAVLDGLGRAMAPWDRRIDVVVLSHPDADHVGGLPAVLARYRVAHVVASPAAHDSPDAVAFQHAVGTEGALRWDALAGTTLSLDARAGVRATVLWPTDGPEGAAAAAGGANNRSAVLLLEHGAVRMLLPGDIETPVEERLLAAGADLRAHVLKVAHHGSGTSSTGAFLEAVQPWLALVSVGADNTYGHPDPDVLTRLAPAAVRRTDRDGRIEVLSDGRRVWLR